MTCPTVADGFDDKDGDRYPNVFEYARGSDPADAASIPTPNFTVASVGGTHTSVSAAVAASNAPYQIVGIKPGIYTGAANDLSLYSWRPKLLIIGLEGAAKTIIDGSAGGDGNGYGWYVERSSVIASLTFRNWLQAISLNAAGQDVRLVDLIVRNNANSSYVAGVELRGAGGTFQVIGSTFIDNVGVSTARQIWVDSVRAARAPFFRA